MSNGAIPCVVDTNVVCVANLLLSVASAECVQTCARRLREICADGHVILDDEGRIFTEYRKKALQNRGQKGVGDEFVKWIITNQYNPERCTRVALTPKKDERDFEEFPDHAGLVGFDRSDRVFVAVANAHPDHPPILAACDTDHWKCRVAFAECGILVEFLCEADVRSLSKGRGNG